jgi:hypothetical protein
MKAADAARALFYLRLNKDKLSRPGEHYEDI